jgi:hypothetical protein
MSDRFHVRDLDVNFKEKSEKEENLPRGLRVELRGETLNPY